MKISNFLAIVSAMVVLTGTGNSAFAQNLIVNGDFTAGSAAFTTWPGYVGGANPAAITDWVSFFGYPAYGVNGAGTGIVPDAFGPVNDGGQTYAFIQGIPSNPNNLLGQFLPLLAVSTQYQLEMDVAGRAGETNNNFRVVVGDSVAEFYNSGTVPANPGAFIHFRATFTTPATIITDPYPCNIQLWNVPLVDSTVNFANVSLVALPLPARMTLLDDTFDTADTFDLNDNLAARESGVLAPVSNYISGQSSVNDIVEISNNTLKFKRLDDTGTQSMIAAPAQNFFNYEVNSNFRVECDINIQSADPTGVSSWAGISLRGATAGLPVTAADCFSMYVRSDGAYEVFDGAPPSVASGGTGSLNGQTNYHVVFNINNNVARITINDMAVPFSGATYSHTIVHANTGNYVSFVGFGSAAAVPATITYDNFVVSVVPVTTPAPVLLNPGYHIGTGTASLQFNSVAQGFYVLESKVNLNDPIWTKVANIVGAGGLQTVSFPSASPTAFFRLRVPLP